MIYKFQVEVITPLVIAGADNRNPDLKAEGLRPPSLRGAMRFWFRAMMGGIVGAPSNYKTLRDLESQVFGATDQGSPVRLRTYPLNTIKSGKAYLCMNDQRSKKSGAPKDYDKIQKSSIAPNEQFLIQLDGRNGIEIILALCSLWLTAILGGLGNRSRRGFGSLALSPDAVTTEAIQSLGLDFSYPDESLGDIAQWLEKGLNQAHGHFKSYVSSIGSPPPARFPVLLNSYAKLWLIKPQNGFWATWQEAMNGLREHVYRDYKKTKGLQEIGSAKPGSRLASPLIIQIKRAALDKYLGVLLVFDEQHNKQQYFGVNWSDFISFLKKPRGYEYQEVTLP